MNFIVCLLLALLLYVFQAQVHVPAGICGVKAGKLPERIDIASCGLSQYKGVTHLCVGALRHLTQVVLSTSGDPAKEDLLGDTPPQGHAHAVQQLLFGVQVLLLGQVLSVAQALPSRNDGHLHR